MPVGNISGSNQYERKSANLPDSISQYKAAKMLNEAQELKAIESERARERMVELAGTRKADPVEMLPQGVKDTGKTRDKVAEQLGMSGRTYDKAHKVWEAAESGNELAQELVQKIDAGKETISGADRPSKKDKNFDSANLPDGISQSQAAKKTLTR